MVIGQLIPAQLNISCAMYSSFFYFFATNLLHAMCMLCRPSKNSEVGNQRTVSFQAPEKTVRAVCFNPDKKSEFDFAQFKRNLWCSRISKLKTTMEMTTSS